MTSVHPRGSEIKETPARSKQSKGESSVYDLDLGLIKSDPNKFWIFIFQSKSNQLGYESKSTRFEFSDTRLDPIWIIQFF